jgi:hypothetical protein
MRIRAVATIEKTDDIEVTMALTMSVKDWHAVADALKGESGMANWPRWKVAGLIRDTLHQVLHQITQSTDSLE